ncbi:MAG: hypothetical protein ACI4ES_07080 [Roseburia sp.]
MTREKILEFCESEIWKQWESQPDTFPTFLEEKGSGFESFSIEQKKKNEQQIQDFLQQMQKLGSKVPESSGKREEKETTELTKTREEIQWKKDIEEAIHTFFQEEQFLQIQTYMKPETVAAFEREAKKFVAMSRRFDRELRMEQIYQAIRNYFIYAMILEMQGEEQCAKETVWAYSMLYPYTDNYIDAPKRSREEKVHYNFMIEQALKGEEVLVENELEEKTVTLVKTILEAYFGWKKDVIQKNLLLLLEAQGESLFQQKDRRGKTAQEKEIFKISAYKGSTSVLADYFFATEEWKKEEAAFYLKFGFLLQLVDDLQDVEEDQKNQSDTLMTLALKQGNIEQYVNRLLWFGWELFQKYLLKKTDIVPFVWKHCCNVALFAVAMNPKAFSKEYVERIEKVLPFRKEFFRSLKKKKAQGTGKTEEMERQQMKILETFVF